MEGKHYHVPQSSALVLPLWNFDTEMPKVTALVYQNPLQDIAHVTQLEVEQSNRLHWEHTLFRYCTLMHLQTHVYT